MCKLLVKLPTGEQSIEDIDETGEYFDKSCVIWDTRTQGKMPKVEIGKMKVVNGVLVNNGEYLPDHAAAIREKTIPLEVPMTAVREVLIKVALFDSIERLISKRSKIDFMLWDKSAAITRSCDLVEIIRVELGLTKSQIDDLFIEAERIRKLKSGGI